MLIRGAIAVVLLVLIGYGFMEAGPLLAGPSLTITSPAPVSTSPDGFVSVSGIAKRVNTLTLDGAPLLTDETGTFSRVLVLPRGGGILVFAATDRFGRTITKQESVYVP